MASGLRKASVLRQGLPPVISLGDGSYGYLTRYRIVSEDRNRFSAWSPVKSVVAFDAQNLPGTVDGDIAMINNSVFVTWGDALDRPRYDIFVALDNNNYFYHGTSPIHTYNFLNQLDVSITNIEEKPADGIIVVTTSTPHYADVGDLITISGVNYIDPVTEQPASSIHNGNGLVDTVLSDTSFEVAAVQFDSTAWSPEDSSQAKVSRSAMSSINVTVQVESINRQRSSILTICELYSIIES